MTGTGHDQHGRNPVGPRRPVNRPRVANPEGRLPVQQRRELFPNKLRGERETAPERVVPPGDNPLMGWRSLGFLTLSWDQPLRRAGANPIVAYFTGRRRGRFLEDALSAAPWLLLLAVDVAGFLWLGSRPADVLGFIVAVGIAGVPLLPMWGVLATSYHFRRAVQSFPLEEIVLTRLSTRDIVYGFALRPAVTMAAANAYHVVLALAAAAMLVGPSLGGDALGGAFVVILLFLRGMLFNLAAESGVSVAVRAHFCIRSAVVATARALYDLLLVAVLLAGIIGVVWIFVLLSALIMAEPLLALFGFILVLATVFAGISGCAYLVSSTGAEALAWTGDNPGEWWISRMGEPAQAGRQVRRGLFTPWVPLENLRRSYRAPRPPRGSFRGRR